MKNKSLSRNLTDYEEQRKHNLNYSHYLENQIRDFSFQINQIDKKSQNVFEFGIYEDNVKSLINTTQELLDYIIDIKYLNNKINELKNILN